MPLPRCLSTDWGQRLRQRKVQENFGALLTGGENTQQWPLYWVSFSRFPSVHPSFLPPHLILCLAWPRFAFPSQSFPLLHKGEQLTLITCRVFMRGRVLPGCTGSLTKLMPCSHHAHAVLMPSSPVVRSSSESPQSPSPHPQAPQHLSAPHTDVGQPLHTLTAAPAPGPAAVRLSFLPPSSHGAWLLQLCLGNAQAPMWAGAQGSGMVRTWGGGKFSAHQPPCAGTGGTMADTAGRCSASSVPGYGARPTSCRAARHPCPTTRKDSILVLSLGCTASPPCPQEAQHPCPVPRWHRLPHLSAGSAPIPALCGGTARRVLALAALRGLPPGSSYQTAPWLPVLRTRLLHSQSIASTRTGASSSWWWSPREGRCT